MSYEFLTQETIPAYLASRAEMTGVIDSTAIESVVEVGDGNLNLVFIVQDRAGKSVVLKQALPYVRLVGPDWPMTPERAAREAYALNKHAELSPDLVPLMYFFDPSRYVIGLENLSTFRVWRGALMEGLRHEGVASDMGVYVANLAFGTSVLAIESEEHKAILREAINPQLCKITEDLVFTEPHDDIGRNKVLPSNEADAAFHAKDPLMINAMGEAKWLFMTRTEALIHADLHTGSVMVRAKSGVDGDSESRAFDPEFAFYGPVAFDLGALWANYTLAAARWTALGDQDMANWCLDLPRQTWAAFESRYRELFPDRIDARVWTDDLMENMVSTWRRQTWLFAAAKMSRRIVGLAKVADIETLDPAVREGAARGILALARQVVAHRDEDDDPNGWGKLASGTLLANRTG
jgi:5-methylthioribose kinase